MRVPVISAVGHVALRVEDLDAALSVATNVMGLREVERDGDWVYLTHGSMHHSLQLSASARSTVDHIGLEVSGTEALAALRERVEQASVPIVASAPLDPGLADAVVFEGPEGYVFEAYIGMASGQPTYAPTGVRPERFGHVNLFMVDAKPMVSFLEEILDFRVSDYVGPGAFMRCNSDHHGIGVAQADSTRMHHMAWQVESIVDLGHLGDQLDDHGRHLLWGPVRHGPGNNIAAYFRDFGGLVVEYYADLQQIHNDADHVPGVWELDDPRFYSRWSRHALVGFRELGLTPVAARGGR
jgi:catechol 2,3-dioxygenase